MSSKNSSPDNTENEHLLEHKWTLWFRPPSSHSNAAWESSQKEYFSASTVEEFWRGFHKLPRIGPGHPVNCDYSLFREGIKPAWEDEFNSKGGRWTYTVERRNNSQSNLSTSAIIEQVWLDVMLCLVGEGFDPYGHMIAGGVCGIRNPKRNQGSSENMTAKIHIWTKDAEDTESIDKIGQILKSVLHAPDGQLNYSPHETPGNKSGGRYAGGNNKITL